MTEVGSHATRATTASGNFLARSHLTGSTSAQFRGKISSLQRRRHSQSGRTLMRAIIVPLLICVFSSALAEAANPCKDCSDHLKVCRVNYQASTCKTEYDICM